MNIFDELNNRWFRVFEHKNKDQQILQIGLMDSLQIADDVKLLQDRVKELESEVSGLHNQVSSKYGPLVDLRNGEVYYRLRGLFVRLMSIYAALDFFVGLLQTDQTIANKFRKEAGEEVEKEIKEIFNDPI